MTSKASVPTDNPTHAELVEALRKGQLLYANVGGVNIYAGPTGLERKAATFIESQASRIEELEAELRALRADAANPDNGMWTFWNDKARKLAAEKDALADALQAIDRIVGENIKDNGTDINRMNIKGEWFTGPPVDACFRILRGFQEVARAALGGKP